MGTPLSTWGVQSTTIDTKLDRCSNGNGKQRFRIPARKRIAYEETKDSSEYRRNGSSRAIRGFMIHDTKNWTKFSKEKFTPKTFEDYDVDIENECCGVCGSDVHTITGGWGELATAPICVGHEIIGKVLRVGCAGT